VAGDGLEGRVTRRLETIHRVPTAVRLVVETVGACLRHCVRGLASEAAFFMLLSLPPLILALYGAWATSATFSEARRSTK